MQDKWWGWAAVVIIFVIVQAWRALIRSVKANNGDGLARLNAAAERILKERGASASNPIPRSAPQHKQGVGATRTRTPSIPPKSMLPKSNSTPAVIRRGGLLSNGQEPVIQRRR